MKILIVCPEYPPRNIGGGGIIYKNLAMELRTKGHQVRVIAGNFTNRQIMGRIEQVRDRGISVHFVPLLSPPKIKSFDATTYTPPTITGFLFLIKQLIKSRNEVIHLHGVCHPLIDIAAFICIFTRKKYVITCHGIPLSPERSGRFWKFLLKFYLSSIERIVIKKAAIATVVSNSSLKECHKMKLSNKNMIVIPNGLNKDLLAVKSKPINELEKKYFLKGRRIIFAIGRLNQNKGFQHLINIMLEVTMKHPKVTVIIAGVGSYYKTLKEQIYEKKLSKLIKLVGWITEEEKAAFYKHSEVVVFPSLHEPFGLVILEALSMHKPIIAFNTESAAELINNENNGIIVPLADEKKLSAAITRMLADDPLRQKIVANTYAKMEIFEWNNIINNYINTYRKVYIKNANSRLKSAKSTQRINDTYGSKE